MCGIFGYVGSQEDAAGIVLRGLKKLEYRGYDSWGVAIGHAGRTLVEKKTGKIGDATLELTGSTIGLGHTRWATHGGVTEPNAHPHVDCTGRLALIHNGIVSNYRELREPLIRSGHCFRSETDTEVVAHLLEECISQTPSGSEQLLTATRLAFARLRGLNAIAVLDVLSGRIAAAKTGSPLVVGFSEHGNMLASDYSALLEHTRRVSFIDDGQVALLSDEACRLFDATTGQELTPRITEVEWEAAATELSGYPDYMTKEIHEQPDVLRRIAGGWRDHARRLGAMIRGAGDVFIIGCGTANHAALAAQYLFARIAGRRVTVASASEFGYLREFVSEGALLIALSQSGETIDVIDAARTARERGAKIAAMVNVEGSTLWRLADLTVPLGAGPERCVLATKSFTAKLAILLLTAYDLGTQIDSAAESIARAADEIERLLVDARRDVIRQIAEAIHRRDHLFVIGRGPSYPLALEAALKVKEVSYIHAEGFAGGDLKHGVIALIEPGTPCLVLAPHDETFDDIMAGAMQVKARGATLIGMSPEPHDAFDYHIAVADLGPASAIVNAPPAQLLGYYLALLRGHDPDKPRNLAKSVTVK
jgi:glucosamine--fructose-6-phosphate aminotransferase (isomerizing)